MYESTNLSAADIAAVTRNNDGGMFGNDSWAWIIILLLFGWGGNRGFGGGNGVGENYVLATDFATIERKLDGVNTQQENEMLHQHLEQFLSCSQ